MEVGVNCEESHVLELDEYVAELHNVFVSTSAVRLDPELLQVLSPG